MVDAPDFQNRLGAKLFLLLLLARGQPQVCLHPRQDSRSVLGWVAAATPKQRRRTGLGEAGRRRTRGSQQHKAVTRMHVIARDGNSLPPKLKDVKRAVTPEQADCTHSGPRRSQHFVS